MGHQFWRTMSAKTHVFMTVCVDILFVVGISAAGCLIGRRVLWMSAPVCVVILLVLRMSASVCVVVVYVAVCLVVPCFCGCPWPFPWSFRWLPGCLRPFALRGSPCKNHVRGIHSFVYLISTEHSGPKTRFLNQTDLLIRVWG
jgi:hypothetical protein